MSSPGGFSRGTSTVLLGGSETWVRFQVAGTAATLAGESAYPRDVAAGKS